MRKMLVSLIVILTMALASAPTYASAQSDYELALSWASAHGDGYTIEKVVTKAKGGTKGQVKGTKWIVKYPKKVKKGKTVTVYMVESGDDVVAMVCFGKVKN